ncbi:MAG: GAF domain-containing protein [Bryobacteraceae bacterium]
MIHYDDVEMPMMENDEQAFLHNLKRLATVEGRLDEALRLVVQQFSADTGTLHVVGEDSILHLKAATAGVPLGVLEAVRKVPVGKGMAGLAVERRQPVTSCNIQSDTSGDVRPGARMTGMEGAIVVPMMRDGDAAGALGIANKTERTFTEDEVRLLLKAGSTMIS